MKKVQKFSLNYTNKKIRGDQDLPPTQAKNGLSGEPIFKLTQYKAFTSSLFKQINTSAIFPHL
jgi:hypothetical protein